MTSYTNPDVDRVSLDRRVSALEDKFGISGPGGGSGGGAGGGAGGGSSPIILGAIDFDQYPDNSWSEDREGLIFKMSIDDFPAIGATILPGFSLKICGIIPKIYQYPLYDSLPSVLFARCKADQNLSLPTTGSHQFVFTKQINWTPWLDFINEKMPASKTEKLSFNILYFSYPPSQGSFSYNSFGIEIKLFSDNSARLILLQNLVNASTIQLNWQALQGVGFGATCYGFYYNSAPFYSKHNQRPYVLCGIDAGWGSFVKDSNKLSSTLKQIYPKSWVS